jgi:F-type H+-transporting ATPase subunit a
MKINKKYILVGSIFLAIALAIFGLTLGTTEAAQIKLSSDIIFNLFGLGITNSMLATWATMLILVVLAIVIRARISVKPGKLQLTTEVIVSFFLEKLELATGSKKDAKFLLPFIVTIFLLFLIGNQFALLPVISSLTFGDAMLFRTPSADFGLTIAMTLLLLGLGHLMVITRSPIRHLSNYIKIHKIFQIRKLKDIPNTLLELFLGAMDIIGEIAKVASMSARLFGNVAAGELMVVVIGGLALFTAYFVPLPFIFLSGFSGLVQAFVFALLGVQFAALTLNSVKEDN